MMEVTYIDSMGTDLSVVNAARVSHHKRHEEFEDSDKKLIKYLAKHKHWTPFGHTAVTVYVKAPIFVARQLGKHQVGLVWNEVSRRYVDSEPEFYVPSVWRKRAENVKQGSGKDLSGPALGVTESEYEDLLLTSRETYKTLLKWGVCPEQARMVLPQSMMTEWYWTGNLISFSNMYKLRTDEHSQRETQQVAHMIGDTIAPLFPYSWEALTSTS